jgi:hypothetical protein
MDLTVIFTYFHQNTKFILVIKIISTNYLVIILIYFS